MPDIEPLLGGSGEPIVADGAYGTALRGSEAELRGTSAFPNEIWERGRPVELLNLDAPEVVLGLARGYVGAGAEVLWTNTFGVVLAGLWEDARRDAVVRAGVEIARAAGNCALPVLAAFGPLRGEAVGGYAGLAEVAMLAGAEGVVLETMTDAEDARAGVAVMVGAGVPVAVTFTAVVDAQGAVRTLCGKPLGDAARRVEDAGAMAVGVNCCDGPATVLAGVTELRGVVGVPIIARPNAGVERTMGAEEFGAWGARLFAAGAAVVGGCCGTTPGHIAALAGGMLRPRA